VALKEIGQLCGFEEEAVWTILVTSSLFISIGKTKWRENIVG
jgi:hypothetical protein